MPLSQDLIDLKNCIEKTDTEARAVSTYPNSEFGSEETSELCDLIESAETVVQIMKDKKDAVEQSQQTP